MSQGSPGPSTVPTKEPTWGDGTSEPLTVEERNQLLEEYCLDHNDPTASGFANYARESVVNLVNEGS